MPRRVARWVATFLLGLSALLLGAAAHASDLARFLAETPAATLVPGADGYGEPAGDPPVAPVLDDGKVVAHVFLNSDHAGAVGYSGRPIHILVAIDDDAVVRGARLVEHHEPIVLVGIPESTMREVITGYIGVDATALVGAGAGERTVDIVSGATVTVMVIDDSILRASLAVARRLGLGGLAPTTRGATPPPTLRSVEATPMDWTALVAEGAVRRLAITVADINRAYEASGDRAAAARPERGDPGAFFIDMYAAQVSVPAIGVNILGEAQLRNLESTLEPGQQAIVLAARGHYSFKGSGYVRGGIFDRFQLIQGDRSIRFRDLNHERLRRVAAAEAPDLDEVDLFRIPPDAGFEPAIPWRIELLVARETAPREKAFLTFDLAYQLPERYVEPPPPPAPTTTTPTTPIEPAPPLWPQMWMRKRGEVAVLLVALAVLSAIFFFQTSLVRRPRLTRWVRYGFLLFTLLGVGLYANAQLSVVNILAVFNALVTGFDWSYFLMEPLVFVLWGAAAIALVLWGRGAYCGWLCPFGALQELTNHVARALKVPQWRVPWGLHERAWALKYLVFLALFGVSLHSLALAEQLAEVEPFKTAIVLKFAREWPFVAFALALVLVGLFVERFYCRYLCALGAALAIPGRMRIFDWLKRYRQCGNPCQRCANDCMVQAIHPEGPINPNECLYCLNCQQLYVDEHRCPVMIAKREKRERRAAQVTPRTSERIEALLTEIREGRAQSERAEERR
ncbi:MAG: regulatory protein NosR [Ectothiorhodospiraceae bacterium]|nr:regulatory protein NosR [Chromatiales bacterium]MCP5153619.1 regulatory protein NosR [Ectothiorhodospiraceae bacterium]